MTKRKYKRLAKGSEGKKFEGIGHGFRVAPRNLDWAEKKGKN